MITQGTLGARGTLYCRPKLRGVPLRTRTSRKYCSECKMKVRGRFHTEGKHHKDRTEEGSQK